MGLIHLLLFVATLLRTTAVIAYATPSRRHGTIKEFDFVVTYESYAPDGFSRDMLLVNGQSPGPVLEVDQDDVVIVRVQNDSPYNTTVHFHGIEMFKTSWSDGVPGVTQRAIEPGRTFVHNFTATQYGSYWYHSHFKGQIEDGLYGPILIHPRQGDPKPFNLISPDSGAVNAMIEAERNVKPLIITDFNHFSSEQKWEMSLAAGLEDSCYDSILFNGKGSVQCLSADEVAQNLSPPQKHLLSLFPNSTMTDKSCVPPQVIGALGGGKLDLGAIPAGMFSGCKATSGSTEIVYSEKSECGNEHWIALDIIGAINFLTSTFSIDEHDMWVYAMDGGYIEPQKVQAIYLNNGDRYSVLVNTTKTGQFQIRNNANSVPQIIIGHAILSVGGVDDGNATSQSYITIGGAPVSSDVVFFNQSIAHPYPPSPIPEKADAFFPLVMEVAGASYLWTVNYTKLEPTDLDNNVPTLFHPQPYIQNNVTITTLNNTWVDLLFIGKTLLMPPHPMHKHGNHMYQIGSGSGTFNWSSTEEAMQYIPEQFNLVNPPRRDAFNSPATLTGPSWLMVRYQVTNPGPWLLHCHINNHAAGGMMMVIQDGVDAWPTVPEAYLDFEA
ncbi:hypothetical protein ANO11243_007690 [Dothideomycetidae sp. 11243]|nr:hypothetical protein ANO11243_007690 [fungal sp. No.11243]